MKEYCGTDEIIKIDMIKKQRLEFYNNKVYRMDFRGNDSDKETLVNFRVSENKKVAIPVNWIELYYDNNDFFMVFCTPEFIKCEKEDVNCYLIHNAPETCPCLNVEQFIKSHDGLRIDFSELEKKFQIECCIALCEKINGKFVKDFLIEDCEKLLDSKTGLRNWDCWDKNKKVSIETHLDRLKTGELNIVCSTRMIFGAKVIMGEVNSSGVIINNSGNMNIGTNNSIEGS